MSMSNETCNRATKVFSLLKDDPMTVAMYDRNREFLEPIFYKTLREKVQLPNATENELIDIANFIDWTKRDGRDVNIELSAKELAIIETMIELQVYKDTGVQPDQTLLPVWELM